MAGWTRNKVLLVFLFCFLFLFAFRPQAIFYPPYWDGILGPFSTAIWLSENDFNYEKLAMEMPGYKSGGPRANMHSLGTLLLAVSMKLVKDPKTLIFLLHVMTAGFSAGIIVIFF